MKKAYTKTLSNLYDMGPNMYSIVLRLGCC